MGYRRETEEEWDAGRRNARCFEEWRRRRRRRRRKEIWV